jgi:hypothetical protein
VIAPSNWLDRQWNGFWAGRFQDPGRDDATGTKTMAARTGWKVTVPAGTNMVDSPGEPVYQPRFPKHFGCIEDVRSFCRTFVDWYYQPHHHVGIVLTTPDQVHKGRIEAVHEARQLTLEPAFRDNPERFVKKPPIPPAKPTAAWINPPTPEKTA